ncbi:Sin3 histone deacetylase corepressor complex component [Nesidiocoris tenuis]|uniref:Sin3 histone deacetylase corepressor complex component n=1 Tax=Nesidiocoris tenuis TaxID=355587 RepID=A0ABN7AE29_9HEMI|nr:Sin3 histone deacetylase corepressor complex component [Nesidiocoris tenuis]
MDRSIYGGGYGAVGGDEYDFEDPTDDQDEDADEPGESDEDTEDASENEFRRHEPPIVVHPAPQLGPMPPQRELPDLKEQIYQEKLSHLKSQLQQLSDGSLPEYIKKVRKLEQSYKERLRITAIWREHAIDLAEKDYIAEKKAATKEYEEKKIEMKENLIQDMEEKRKNIEAERLSMELGGDSNETKPAMTRKLRRRPNDPPPVPEKRRGKISSLPSVSFLLKDEDIEADLKAISRGNKNSSSNRKPANGLQSLGPIIPDPPSSEVRIEDGKLLYDRKWFHRGQAVFVEGKDVGRFPSYYGFPAVISAIGTEAIHVKKTSDSTKVRIYTSQLVKGKFIIKRRAS